MAILMTNNEFVESAKNIANNYKTVYANGTVGQLLTNDLITNCANRLPKWYTEARIQQLRQLVGKGYYAFDCSGLIKGILWGWNNGYFSGYGKNGYPPDTNESGLLSMCTNVATDFSDIPVGAFLWVKGHCGLYIGNKQAIECTPKWQNKVQITSVANLGNTSGNSRTWTKWGKLPWVNYQKTPSVFDYSAVFDADFYLKKYPDLRKAFGDDKKKAYDHFVKYGMKEERQACKNFIEPYYRKNYKDLQLAYGNDYPSYYQHYCKYGKSEGRIADRVIVPHHDSAVAHYKDEKYSRGYVTTRTTNLYKTVSLDSDAICGLLKGSKVYCFGYFDFDSDGSVWLYVSADVNGRQLVGFVPKRYLE